MTTVRELVLERKSQADDPPLRGPAGVVLITPAIDEDYWSYRVQVTDRQAIVGFPKFTTIGIGFSVEDDWNTNLPYRAPTEDIWKHIKHNAGDPAITKEIGVRAIRMIQDAVATDRGEVWTPMRMPKTDR